MSNRPSRFLGRISFALYLVHLPLICSFSCALFIMTVDVLPYWAVVLLIGVLTLALSLTVAFVFAVLVEEHFLRWLKRIILSVINPPSTSLPIICEPPPSGYALATRYSHGSPIAVSRRG